MLKQVICAIKIRRAPARHDNIDFQPIITRTSEIKPLSIAVVADKVYDNEENHCTCEKRSESIQEHHFSKVQIRSNMENTWQVQKTEET